MTFGHTDLSAGLPGNVPTCLYRLSGAHLCRHVLAHFFGSISTLQDWHVLTGPVAGKAVENKCLRRGMFVILIYS